MTQAKQATITDTEINQIQDLISTKKDTNLIPKELDENEIKEIEETFKNVKDFRQLGEKITAPIDNIISKTSQIIEKDPIMDVSDELSKINEEVQGVYKEIIHSDSAILRFLKTIPGLKQIIEKIEKEKFNLKPIKGKIEEIFSGFDQSYESLVKSIQMQKEFLEGLEENLSKVKAYYEYIQKKAQEFEEKLKNTQDENLKQKYKLFLDNIKYFLGNLQVLIGNLELARKRLIIRLDSSTKLALAMQSSRPIFKTLLSVAIIETAGQKALDASTQAITKISETIDNMSSDLTEKAIQSSKKTEELSSKPILDPQKFIENVKKLKTHFEEIENYKEQIKEQAQAERQVFKQATEELHKIKEIKSKDLDELENTLIGK